MKFSTNRKYPNRFIVLRHIDSRFDKCWKPSEEDPYWPSYVFDKVRLYLERPRTQVRSENSIFDIVHNRRYINTEKNLVAQIIR
jgi:hypothetical protein